MIITPFGRELPDYLFRLRTPLRVPALLKRETRGFQPRIRECLAPVTEAHQTSRERSTRRRVLGFLSLSRIAAGGKELGLWWRFYDSKSEESICDSGHLGRALGSSNRGTSWPRKLGSSG